MKRIMMIFFLLLSFFVGAEENVNELLLKNIDLLLKPAEDVITEINIITYAKNSPLSIKTFACFIDNKTGQFLLICTSPLSEHGFTYLKRKNRIWTYTPVTRTFFSASTYDFIEGTVLRIEDFLPKRYSEDYTLHSSIKTEVNHILALKLFLRAKSDSAPYDRITLWIDEESRLPLKEEGYDSHSNLLKAIQYSGWREKDGWYQPSKILITDTQQNSITSYITVKKTTLSIVPEYVFTRSFVEFITQ